MMYLKQYPNRSDVLGQGDRNLAYDIDCNSYHWLLTLLITLSDVCIITRSTQQFSIHCQIMVTIACSSSNLHRRCCRIYFFINNYQDMQWFVFAGFSSYDFWIWNDCVFIEGWKIPLKISKEIWKVLLYV